MPWWKRRANSASSSPSPSFSPSSYAAAMMPFFPRRRRRKDSRRHISNSNSNSDSNSNSPHKAPPRLTRQRKLRHLRDLELPSEDEDEDQEDDPRNGRHTRLPNSTPVSRSTSYADYRTKLKGGSSSSAMLTPQPLPMPESTGPGRGSDNDGAEFRTLLAENAGLGDRLAHPTINKTPERVTTSHRASSPAIGKNDFQDSNVAKDANYMLHFPDRKSTSGISNLALTPGRLSPGEFSPSTYLPNHHPQIWSAPEIFSSDFTMGHSPHLSAGRIPGSSEQSPLSNYAIRSPHSRSSPSTSHLKASPENSWHGSNSGTNVHPLPLPPGSLPNLQPQFAHQTAKSDASSKTSQWQKGKLIGSGTFGNVYIATNRHTGALCAMKEVNLIPDDPKSSESIKQLQQEIKLLSQLKHQNIVQYYGSEVIEDRFYIYLEYVYPGSINKYVREHCGAITESIVRNFTRHILRGLSYLHSKQTIHRDVKGANLLVNSCGVVKLADFGMAKHLSGTKDVLSMRGTPYWMAPEVLHATMNKEVGYDYAVDIWSLGCTIIEMFTGKHPWSGFESAAALFKVLLESPEIPEALSSEGKDFLQCCFRRNPVERPTAKQLLEHPFVSNTPYHDYYSSIQALEGMKLSDSLPSPKSNNNVRSNSKVKTTKYVSNVHSGISPAFNI